MVFYRRNLPHWHPEGNVIFLTWRLFGSLPAWFLERRRTARIRCATTTYETRTARIHGEEMRAMKQRGCAIETDHATRQLSGKEFVKLDRVLDAAKSGPLWLRDPKIAECCQFTMLHGAKLGRYELLAYVVMPNHVHVLMQPHVPLARITNTVKGIAARDANAVLGRRGLPFWQDESFDHWIRNSAQLERVRHYIEHNPVTAGLARSAESYLWSSAGKVGPRTTGRSAAICGTMGSDESRRISGGGGVCR